MGYGIELLKAGGSQATGDVIGEGLGILTQGIKNKQQLKQARRLQDLGLEAEATRLQRNEALAMRMFENTGYGAQVDQMKRAGLNPALLYGMSAGSGGSTAQAAATGNTGSAQSAQSSQGGNGMGLMVGQMALLQAQKENIEADTELKKSQKGDTGAAMELKNFDLQFKKDSKEDNLDIIRGTFSKLQEELNKLNRENRQGDETYNDQVKKLQSEATAAYLTTLLIDAETKNKEASTEAIKQSIEQSKAEINKWAQEIAQKWKELDLKGREILIKSFEAELKAKYPGLMQVIGGKVNDVIAGLEELLGGDKQLRKPNQ